MLTIRTFKGTQQKFKIQVDRFLSLIPDQPACEGVTPNNYDIDGNNSNAIIDWVRNTSPLWICPISLYMLDKEADILAM